jgi:hypothetical protein
LDARLASILDGTTTPDDAQDSLGLAETRVAKDLHEPAGTDLNPAPGAAIVLQTGPSTQVD